MAMMVQPYLAPGEGERVSLRGTEVVFKAAGERAGGGPTVLELITLRMEGHAIHDDASYVPRDLYDEFLARDPVDRFRSWLTVNQELTEYEEQQIAGEVAQTIEAAVLAAEASPLPDPSTLLQGVYADQGVPSGHE
jgi:TPP-dependent pyruvate/acetoin dehydrogenase alpha subunit